MTFRTLNVPLRHSSPFLDGNLLQPSMSFGGHGVVKTSEMAKELEAVHQEVEDRDVQMAALTKALSEAGIGLRYEV